MTKRLLRHFWWAVRFPLRVAAGIFLVLLGIVGLILPIMPGWIFLIPGLLLLTGHTRFGIWLRLRLHILRRLVTQQRPSDRQRRR